jgi:hypothetical protein
VGSVNRYLVLISAFHTFLCVNFCLSSAVGVEVQVILKLPSSGNIDLVEIESRLQAIDDNQLLSSRLNRILSLLGMKRAQFFARKTKSVSTLFICDSSEELHCLHEHYKSGWIKIVLEEVFTFLADEPVEICLLEWATDDFDSCLHQFGKFYLTRMLLSFSKVIVVLSLGHFHCC